MPGFLPDLLRRQRRQLRREWFRETNSAMTLFFFFLFVVLALGGGYEAIRATEQIFLHLTELRTTHQVIAGWAAVGVCVAFCAGFSVAAWRQLRQLWQQVRQQQTVEQDVATLLARAQTHALREADYPDRTASRPR